MSSYLGSARSLSPVVLSCLLVAVFLFRLFCLSFVLRRLASVVLVCLRFPQSLLLDLLLRQCFLVPVLRRFYPLLLVAMVVLVFFLIAAIVTRMVMLSLIAGRSSARSALLLLGLVLLLRHAPMPPSLSRIL